MYKELCFLSVTSSNPCGHRRAVVTCAVRNPVPLNRGVAAATVGAALIAGSLVPWLDSLPPMPVLVKTAQYVVSNPQSVFSEDYDFDSIYMDERVLLIGKRPVLIKQLWGNPSETSTGVVVWPAGEKMSRYLSTKVPRAALNRSNVLELGTGTGLTTIAVEKLGAKVTCTDGDPRMLELAKENVRANGALKNVSFRQLRWGVEEDMKPLESTSWDWILGADITYKEGAWADIAKTISRLAEKKTKVLIISQRRGVDDIEKFLKTIQEHNLECVRNTHTPAEVYMLNICDVK
ncbi:hypothetical protein NDN08_007412 [Rhodosorus marinus]|uniref:Calmodulin-lysine N-methyltransferase n=1 Tax=Rhodosorus marinus TaxID=101924 RepID=A0AAV8V1Q5_9RHOD|nr:hypothetical protein NDN08_007412 [Rhodosorus marinus]